MKNKKGIMVEFLLRTLIAIIFIGTAVTVASSFFRLTSQAEDSFNDLVGLIKQVKDGETLSMALIMDKETALIGFTSDANKVICKELLNNVYGFLERPKECDAGSACICLCTSGLELDKLIPYGADEHMKGSDRTMKYKCDKIKCAPFQSVDFLNRIDEDDFGSYLSGIDPYKEGNFYTLLDGFIHTRNGPLYIPGMPTRLNEIYVQKMKNKVAVCFSGECFSEEYIKERQPVTVEESKKANFLFPKGSLIGVDKNRNNQAESFYYIEEITKNNFGEYYYSYRLGIKSDLTTTPSESEYLKTLEEPKQDFELRFIKYAAANQSVYIDFDNEDMMNFQLDAELSKVGKVEIAQGSW